jgi:DNA-binding transcriptional LysR family regulator
MIATRLTPPFKAILVAAPKYIEASGEPSSIAQLSQHNCIGFRLIASGGVYAWDLQEKGVDVRAHVRGTVLVTDPLYAKELALAGLGIAYIFEPLVRNELREKRLRCILPRSSIEEPGLFLYFPRRASAAPKLRAFIDTAREILGS